MFGMLLGRVAVTYYLGTFIVPSKIGDRYAAKRILNHANYR
jgi:hypothetical protein